MVHMCLESIYKIGSVFLGFLELEFSFIFFLPHCESHLTKSQYSVSQLGQMITKFSVVMNCQVNKKEKEMFCQYIQNSG